MKGVILPRLRIELWRQLPHRHQASVRAAVLRTAERSALDDLGPSAVFDAIVEEHGHWFLFADLMALCRAINADLPIDDLGALILKSFASEDVSC